MTETINSIDYATGWQYSVTGTNVSNNGYSASSSHDHKHSGCKSNGRNRRSSHKHSNWSRLKQCQLHDHKSGSGISVHDDVSRTRNHKSNCDPKSYRRYLNNRYNKCLYAVAALFLSTPLMQMSVGLVQQQTQSQTASFSDQPAHSGFARSLHYQHVWKRDPVSRSHNELHPYITHSISDKDPFEQRYFEPQYDMRDFVGRTVQVTKIEKNFPWEPGMTIERIPTLKAM